jgi:membrane-associated protease RseP (regulator of RpoE activity)
MMRRWLYITIGALIAFAVAGGALFVATSGAIAKESPLGPNSPLTALQGGPGGKGWLGLSLGQLNSDLAQRLGISRTEGVVVLAVAAGSPAETAGFQNRDVILSVGGNNVTTLQQVAQAARNAAVGSTIQFSVARGSQTLNLNVTVAQQPAAQGPRAAGPKPNGRPGIGGFGFFGGRPGRLPELQGIDPGQLFNHFLGGQLNLTDKDGKPLTVRIAAGTVAAISDTSVTVAPNGGEANVTFSITSNSQVHRLQRGGDTKPQVGDRVTVTAVGDEAWGVIAWAP